MTEGDEALAERSRRGEAAAFEELVRRTHRGVFAQLYLETADAHKAEDLAQEAYLAAWRSIRSLADAKSFRPWLLAIAHSVLLDHLRREARLKRRGKPASLDAAEAVLDRRPLPDEAAQQRHRRERVLSAVREMPGEYRQVLTLRYLLGEDYQSIGRELGITNGSLRGLLSRGAAMLREKLKDIDIA